MVPFESFGTFSYLDFTVTIAVSLAACEIFPVKEWRELSINLGLGSFKLIANGAVRQTIYDYLLVGQATSNGADTRRFVSSMFR